MIAVTVRQNDRHLLGLFHHRCQGPDVALHVWAWIDQRDRTAPYDKGAGPVEGERPGISCIQEARVEGQEPSRRSAASCSASLSAIPISATSSSSVKAAFSSESMSIWPKMSSPARIRMTSSDCTSGEHDR